MEQSATFMHLSFSIPTSFIQTRVIEGKNVWLCLEGHTLKRSGLKYNLTFLGLRYSLLLWKEISQNSHSIKLALTVSTISSRYYRYRFVITSTEIGIQFSFLSTKNDFYLKHVSNF